MPSREEIVEWLRESRTLELALQTDMGDEGKAYMSLRKWDKRATQVASMRCETCKWFDRDGVMFNCDYEWPPEMPIILQEVSKDFGCFSHEQKPAD